MFSQSAENEQAGAGRSNLSRETKLSDVNRDGIINYFPDQSWQPYRVDPYSAKNTDLAYIHDTCPLHINSACVGKERSTLFGLW